MHHLALEYALREYAKLHAKPHHRQLNRYPISREMLYIPIPKLRAFDYGQQHSWEQWMSIFASTGVNECQIWLLFQLEKMRASELVSKKNDLLTLIEYCDNRWISDSLSSIYARILDHDRSLLDTLQERNSSDNLRKRRQSVVSLYYYSRSRKNPLSFAEAIVYINALLQDSDYYVQKGLGWTVRELYNLYPELAWGWIQAHVTEIHPRAWQASTEKLSAEQKTHIKIMRKRS